LYTIGLITLLAACTPIQHYSYEFADERFEKRFRVLSSDSTAVFAIAPIRQPENAAEAEVFTCGLLLEHIDERPVEFRVLRLDLVMPGVTVPAEVQTLDWTPDPGEAGVVLSGRSEWALVNGRFLAARYQQTDPQPGRPRTFQTHNLRFDGVPFRWSDTATLHGEIEVHVDGVYVETLPVEERLVQKID